MTEPDPLPPRASVSQATARTHWIDAVLACGVLAFTFLAASFSARNSDLFMHLAAGRLLANGEYTFGVDPFSYTTRGVYWANHAWLFDLALYAAFQTMGGAALVALKAAAATCTASLMLRLARVKGPFWISGGCTLLAVLVMSPRLLLQPVCLSLLLLAVCLSLLRTGGRALLVLPAVIALWVNLDDWFLLGPLLVALFGMGRFLRVDSGGAETHAGRLPVWLLPACLAACLLSPHHVFALTLPAELSPGVWSSDLGKDGRFAPLFASPWRLAALGRPGGYNLAAWAYFVLLALGATSFAINRPALRDWRLPVFVAFGLLAAWQTRLAPFFAVVAGPIAAINLGEIWPKQTLAGVGRTGLGLACLGLTALTWPGWLQGFHRSDRGLAWSVHADPALERVADTLDHWRKNGVLPRGARTFAVHPDVANYCAWFCRDEKGFLDSRLSLFTRSAADYERLCQAIDPTLRGDAAAEAFPVDEWQRILRDNGIACLVLYDPDLRRLAPGLGQLSRPAGPWELLRIDGQAVVAGWKEAMTAPLASVRFDAVRSAFDAPANDILPPAPEEGAAQIAEPLVWWLRFLDRPGGSTWEAEAAAVYLRLFEDRAAVDLQRQRLKVLARHAAGLAGLPALSASPVAVWVSVASRIGFAGAFLPDLHERPGALPLLSVRAARLGLARRPEDASAWMVLAQAYLSLHRTTIEATASARLPLLSRIRHIQAVTALVQAVNRNPDLASAHETLSLLFAQRGFFDLALQHRRAELRLIRQTGQRPGEEPAAYAGRIEQLEQAVEEMATRLQDSENRFAVHAQPLAAEPLARARLALQLGLAGKALDGVLLPSSPDLYGVAGIRLLLDLLLLTGRAQDARALLDRDELRLNHAALGLYDLPGGGEGGWGYPFLAYDWFDLCQSAAAGQYERTGLVLERMRGRFQLSGRQMSGGTADMAWQIASEVGLGAAPAAVALRIGRRLDREIAVNRLVRGLLLADLHVVEGMLLLESGRPGQARQHFDQALTLYRPVGRGPGQSLAQHYQRRIRSVSAPEKATSP